MYTQNDGAWVKNAAEEAKLVDAMRKGADLVVKATTSRGTETTDTFSLKGLAQALDRAARSASDWRSDLTVICGAGRALRLAAVATSELHLC